MKTVIFFITCTVNIIKQFLLHLYFYSDCPRNIAYCYKGKKSLISFTISRFYIFLGLIYIFIYFLEKGLLSSIYSIQFFKLEQSTTYPSTYLSTLAKEIATHSSILAQEIPWIQDPGRAIIHGITKELDVT